jgi:hypothetical protein
MSITGKVNFKFNPHETHDIAISKAPSGVDWKIMAENIHHLLGKGVQLIPNNMVPQDANWKISGSVYGEMPIFDSPQTLSRVWVLTVKTDTTIESAFSFKAGNQAASSWYINASPKTLYYVESNITQSNWQSFQSIPFTASGNSSDIFRVMSLGCFSVPRYQLSGTTDLAIDDTGFRAGFPIYDDERNPPQKSVRALANTVSSSVSLIRPAGLFADIEPTRKRSPAASQFAVAPAIGVDSNGSIQLYTVSCSVFIPILYSANAYANNNTGSVDYAMYLSGTNALCSATISFTNKEWGHLHSHNIRLGSQQGWFTGSFNIPVNTHSGKAFPSGYTKPFEFNWVLQHTGSGKVWSHSRLLGQRVKPR